MARKYLNPDELKASESTKDIVNAASALAKSILSKPELEVYTFKLRQIVTYTYAAIAPMVKS